MRGEELLEGMRQAQKLEDAAPPLSDEFLSEVADGIQSPDSWQDGRMARELLEARKKLALLSAPARARPKTFSVATICDVDGCSKTIITACLIHAIGLCPDHEHRHLAAECSSWALIESETAAAAGSPP